jgi:catechol 2,3-dioxygenase-like lactoylglutathione lyase family enzyme
VRPGAGWRALTGLTVIGKTIGPRSYPVRNSILPFTLAILLSTLAAAKEPAAFEPRLVALSVANLDETISWYQENLGFKLRDRKDFPQASLRIAFLELQGFELELVEKRKSVSLAAIQKAIPEADDQAKMQGIVKLAFSVADARELAAQMKRRGVRFEMGLTPSNREPGVIFFIVRDNNGNWLQFFSRSQS